MIIENKYEQDINFSFPRIAHFNTTPIKSVLKRNSVKEFTVTFKPKNLGLFSRYLDLQLLDGQYKIPIKLVANSKKMNRKTFNRRGVNCLPNDFQAKYNFVTED